MTDTQPANKEGEIASSLYAILFTLVAAVDRLALAVEALPHSHGESALAMQELPARSAAAAPMAVAASPDVCSSPAAPTAAPSSSMTALLASPEISPTPAVLTTNSSSAAPTVPPPAAPEGLIPTAPAMPPAEVGLTTAASTYASDQPPSQAGSSTAATSTAFMGTSLGSRIPTPDEVRIRYIQTPSNTSKSWFVVTRGCMPGVYATWMETSPLVIGVSRAVFTKWTTKEEALAAYGTAWASGHVIKL